MHQGPTEGLWDQANWGRGSSSRTAKQELETRSTGTVADTDSASELDAVQKDHVKVETRRNISDAQVPGGDVVAGDNLRLCIDDVVDTVVGHEVGLDSREEKHGSIGSTAAADVPSVRFSHFL